MPISGARYRFKDNVRLAFKGNKVVETKKFHKVGGKLKPAGEAKSVGEALRKRRKGK